MLFTGGRISKNPNREFSMKQVLGLVRGLGLMIVGFGLIWAASLCSATSALAGHTVHAP